MTRDEIKDVCRRGNATMDFEIYSEAFGATMQQNVYIPILNWTTGEQETDIDKLITRYIEDCVNSFIHLDKTLFVDQLKDDIFRLFNIYIEATSYAQVPDDLIVKYGNTEANRIFFNGRDKDTVYSRCKFESVLYDNDNSPELRFLIHIKIDWDEEHGLNLFFENGKYISID